MILLRQKCLAMPLQPRQHQAVVWDTPSMGCQSITRTFIYYGECMDFIVPYGLSYRTSLDSEKVPEYWGEPCTTWRQAANSTGYRERTQKYNTRCRGAYTIIQDFSACWSWFGVQFLRPHSPLWGCLIDSNHNPNKFYLLSNVERTPVGHY